MADAPLEVLYNGRCPVCRAGACDIEKRAALSRANVVLTDVAVDPDALSRAGVTLEAVRLKMHAIAPDGRVLAGMPAVALTWATTPPYQWLGRLMQAAPFRWLGAVGYHVSAYVLYAWNKICRRW
jgi:predicted DCC family thiol-disulfide oxidoreductase YuxK